MLYFSFIAVALFATSVPAQCDTNQNPYCAGQPQFEQLCCQYPAVCYWSNRNGDPACCAAGQDCRADGGPGTSIIPVPVTYVQPTTAYVTSVYTQPQQTVTYTPPATTQQFSTVNTVATPAVVIATSTTPPASNAPPASANGVFVTVTQASDAVRYSMYQESVMLLVKVAVTGTFCLFLANVC